MKNKKLLTFIDLVILTLIVVFLIYIRSVDNLLIKDYIAAYKKATIVMSSIGAIVGLFIIKLGFDEIWKGEKNFGYQSLIRGIMITMISVYLFTQSI